MNMIFIREKDLIYQNDVHHAGKTKKIIIIIGIIEITEHFVLFLLYYVSILENQMIA